MVADIQRQINTNVSCTCGSITTGSAASITLLGSNNSRIFVNLSVNNDIIPENVTKVWIKLQAASIDNLKKGILLMPGGTWEMPTDNRYTGEISAISDDRDILIYTSEY